MILDDLATVLQTAGVGTIGVSLFKGGVPLDNPLTGVQDTLVALIEVPGLPPVHVHTMQAATYEQPVVQIVTRGIPYGYAAARTLAQKAFNALDGLANAEHSDGTVYLWVQALQSPFFLRWDELARPLIGFNIRCAKSISL